ncbi:hypothetical protein ENBRE01_1130 [Enteropsectra breve]|nr:hypothetical protein ENBRE01_1130 [Enteropsectra breve]
MNKDVLLMNKAYKEQISKENDALNLVTLCARHQDLVESIVERLLEIQSFNELSLILQENSKIFTDAAKLKILAEIFETHLEELKQAGIITDITALLIKKAHDSESQHLSFLLMRWISVLVRADGKFPSYEASISYFRCLAELFKTSQNYHNYLCVASILSELNELLVGNEELSFLLKSLELKKEPVFKGLFCGISPKSITDIKTMNDSHFTPDAQWIKLIELKQSGINAEFDLKFICFLKTNNISYDICDDQIEIGSYQPVGFTTKLFEIAKKYHVREEVESKVELKREEKKEPEAVVEKPKIVTSEIKKDNDFVKRFRMTQKRFKILYKQSQFRYLDGMLEERNANRRIVFDEANAAFNKVKNLLIENRETIDELFQDLAVKINAEMEKKRREEDERRAIELERIEKEKAEKRWDRAIPEKVPLFSKASEMPGVYSASKIGARKSVLDSVLRESSAPKATFDTKPIFQSKSASDQKSDKPEEAAYVSKFAFNKKTGNDTAGSWRKQ